MILDRIGQHQRYERLHPLFARAFEFLIATDLRTLSPGRRSIDGDRIVVSIDHEEGRGIAGARLEAHRRYIDIQTTIEGREQIGWRPLQTCSGAGEPYDAGRDIIFFDDRPETWLTLPPGYFAIFFPDDAHAPLAGSGSVRKAIVKIQADPD